jgi:phage-related protein
VAVVGEAHIIVRAITGKVADDIKRGFNGLDQNVASRAGATIGRSFSEGFRRSGANNVFGRVADGLRALAPNAERTREQFRSLVKTGYTLNTVLGIILGGIGSLASGLLSLVAAAGAAVQGLSVVVASFVQLRIAAFTASFALKGISQAVAQATGASSAYGKSIKEIREELQQLRFESEEAALSEERAALNLEKARESLRRVQDLPPNSKARREAELAFKEADLAYRRAKDRNADLQDQIENGVSPAGGGGSDPFAGLTEAQKKFAEFLVSIQPAIQKLRDAVAAAFLGPLEEQIGRIINELFPMLEKKLPLIAGALAGAAKNFVDALLKEENIAQLGRVIDGMVPSIVNWGTIFGNVYEILLDVAEALNPIVLIFTEDLIRITGEWRDQIDVLNKSGELTSIFERGYEVLKRFGGIAGNVFVGLGNLISLNFADGNRGGGWVILDWLDRVTTKFRNLGGDTQEGRDALTTFFEGAAVNATVILDTIGAYLGEIFKLADNPAIKETFEILKANAPAFGDLLEKGLEAGPAFAELVGELLQLGNALQDTGAMEIFFGTLADLAKVAADFFKSDLGQAVFTVTGRIFAFALAIGAALGPVKFVFNAIVGNVIFFADKISGLIGIMGGVQTFFLKVVVAGAKLGGVFGTILGALGKVGIFLTGPWGIAIAAAVGALTFFFTQTELGKQIWQGFMDFLGGVVDWIVEAWNNAGTVLGEVFTGIGKFFTDVWTSIQQTFKPIVDFFVTAFKTGFDIIRGIIEVFAAIFLIIFVGIGTGVQAVWDGIKAGFKAVSDFLRPIVEGIRNFFTPIFKGIGDFIGTVWRGIQTGFQKFVDWIKPPLDKIFGFFSTVFNNVKDFLRSVINTYIGFAEGFVNFFIRGLNWIIDRINTIKLAIPELLRPFFGGQRELGFNISRVSEVRLPRLAQGGVVMPSYGGSIVNVAEAGRPERIEPLDPSGLSNRDRALISELTGGMSGGITVNVYPSAGMDEKALAAAVSRRLAFEIKKGTI